MFTNAVVSNKFNFIDKKLADRLGGYAKGDIKFERFQNGIRLAITQSNNYETNLDKVFTTLGTNLGELLNEILK
ncbi:hypothetical protein F3D3_0861 [Fusibacter sp. 3D3]|nr:hypothetical protein F3D3_0861 [Fusibacter sp. 3D3]